MKDIDSSFAPWREQLGSTLYMPDSEKPVKRKIERKIG
jgi:hypothetical protein